MNGPAASTRARRGMICLSFSHYWMPNRNTYRWVYCFVDYFRRICLLVYYFRHVERPPQSQYDPRSYLLCLFGSHILHRNHYHLAAPYSIQMRLSSVYRRIRRRIYRKNFSRQMRNSLTSTVRLGMVVLYKWHTINCPNTDRRPGWNWNFRLSHFVPGDTGDSRPVL